MGLVEELRQVVGADYVATSPDICSAYAYNTFLSNRVTRKSDIIVQPHTTEEVSKVVKLANRYKTPITPKGLAGGTGLGGPIRGGILLDMVQMDKITRIDPVSYKAVAEAGCPMFKLSQELNKVGMMLPTSEYTCGPNVAASAITPVNAFGKTRYGRNCDLVEGFEVVLPTGEIVGVGSLAYDNTYFGPMFRYIHGPDLVGLFVQSNGAYGIVTKVAYNCQKKPPFWGSFTYFWPEEGIHDLVETMLEATAYEFFDIHLNDKWKYVCGTIKPGDTEPKSMLPDEAYFTLLCTVNAFSQEELDAKIHIIDELCTKKKGKLLGSEVGDSFFGEWPTFHAPAASPVMLGMWDTLYKLHNANYFFIPDSINYPTAKFAEVYNRLKEILEKYGLWGFPRLSVFDGFPMKGEVICSQTWNFTNTYENNEYWLNQMLASRDEFREWFGAMGGTHQQHLPPIVPDYAWENQRGAFELARALKEKLDPNNILSPGTFELYQH